MNKYYDGTKLLSLKDINGNTPEIYICTTNRTAGKTTYFSRLLVKRFLKKNEKFCLMYRYNYELDDVSNKFFKDIQGLFFPEYTMQSERRASGIFHELFLVKNDIPRSCGYAISLNSSDQIKKYSHLFSDVSHILFDEYQSETNHYCKDEIQKFISIHTSIARGNGEQYRAVPVYMLSNPVSIINPYYVSLGISERLKADTKFLRGNGYVMEQGYNETASQQQLQGGFNQAFLRDKYLAYSTQNVYLHDSESFVERMNGKSYYLCTLKYNGKNYGIREFPETGIVYCDDRPDLQNPNRITVTTDDHDINYVMLKRNEFFLSNLRFYFEHGSFRFKNLSCKEAVLKALSY